MKKLTTIVCSIALAIYGLSIAMTAHNENSVPVELKGNTIQASTISYDDLSKMQIPKDLQRSLQTYDSVKPSHALEVTVTAKPIVKTKVIYKEVQIPVIYIAVKNTTDSGSVYKTQSLKEILRESLIKDDTKGLINL